MAYITRELERKFLKLNDFFKVILVTGARQPRAASAAKQDRPISGTSLRSDESYPSIRSSGTICA